MYTEIQSVKTIYVKIHCIHQFTWKKQKTQKQGQKFRAYQFIWIDEEGLFWGSKTCSEAPKRLTRWIVKATGTHHLVWCSCRAFTFWVDSTTQHSGAGHHKAHFVLQQYRDPSRILISDMFGPNNELYRWDNKSLWLSPLVGWNMSRNEDTGGVFVFFGTIGYVPFLNDIFSRGG